MGVLHCVIPPVPPQGGWMYADIAFITAHLGMQVFEFMAIMNPDQDAEADRDLTTGSR
jgi:hypothetical protein